jgi:hypothetical protein
VSIPARDLEGRSKDLSAHEFRHLDQGVSDSQARAALAEEDARERPSLAILAFVAVTMD